MASLLSLRGLVKRFGAVVVADRLALDVAEGEALGVLGPNGAGKSSLFGMIAGTLRPDAGTVAFAGTDISALSPQAAAGAASRARFRFRSRSAI